MSQSENPANGDGFAFILQSFVLGAGELHHFIRMKSKFSYILDIDDKKK